MLVAPSAEINPDDLRRDIAESPDAFAVYTDFDGTLVDIAERPEDVKVPAGLPEALARVRWLLGGALAIITGRRLVEIDRYLGEAKLEASGLHGLEFTFEPAADRPLPPREVPTDLMGEIVKIVTADPGLRLENKGPIIAVHYRQSPAAGGRLRAALEDAIRRLKLDHHLKEGRAVIEVLPRGTSKATALLEFMRRVPYAGRRPVMIGDDLADEEAFAVAREAGGYGLRVAGEHFTKGDEPFRHAGEVRAWFAALAGSAGR